MYTGHVATGGAICIEALVPTGTSNGWQPALCVESILAMVLANLLDDEKLVVSTASGPGGVSGALRVDWSTHNPATEYSLAEARGAYQRIAMNHGWDTRGGGVRAGAGPSGRAVPPLPPPRYVPPLPPVRAPAAPPAPLAGAPARAPAPAPALKRGRDSSAPGPAPLPKRGRGAAQPVVIDLAGSDSDGEVQRGKVGGAGAPGGSRAVKGLDVQVVDDDEVTLVSQPQAVRGVVQSAPAVLGTAAQPPRLLRPTSLQALGGLGASSSHAPPPPTSAPAPQQQQQQAGPSGSSQALEQAPPARPAQVGDAAACAGGRVRLAIRVQVRGH